MSDLTLDYAVLAVEQKKIGSKTINETSVAKLLKDVKGCTFARLTQVTDVGLAAAHKEVKIHKVTISNVQLFNNLADFKNVYIEAVKRSAAKIEENNVWNVEEWEAGTSYFEHTDCYSVVKHKTKDDFYLFAIYNGAKSMYIKDGAEMTKEAVAEFMTLSAKKALLAEDTGVVHNKTNDVKHNVIVRTIKFENIVELTANKETLYV